MISRAAFKRLLSLTGMLLCLVLAACLATNPTPVAPGIPPATPSAMAATATASPSSEPGLTATPTTTLPDVTRTPWGNYPGPQGTPVTPIPRPFSGLAIPDGVKTGVLLGIDRPSPFNGRTDAVMLVFYNPDTARASLVSIPPDLFVYLPGYTMQRLNTAYALGGMDLVNSTLEYNFGVRPQIWAAFHLDAFTRLVDQLGGISVYNPVLIWDQCGNIPKGQVNMDGQLALCYAHFGRGMDEGDRNNRQLEVVRQVFLKMVRFGNLARLPLLFSAHQSTVESNLVLNDLLKLVPLTLKLGDENRVAVFYLDENALKVWQMQDRLQSQVFLPRRSGIRSVLQDAINFVLTPAPLTNQVKTLEYLVTASPTITLTPTRTPTPYPTLTRTRTPTLTRTPTPRPTRHHTSTLTPSQTLTPSETTTPSQTMTPSPSPTETPTS